MHIDETKLGAAVREVRTDLGITQREMADQTGLTVNYISLFENGHRGISIAKLNSVAEVLGVPASLITTMAVNIEPSPEHSSDRLFRQIQKITRQAISLYTSARPR